MGVDSSSAVKTEVAYNGSPGWDPALPAQRGMILNYLRFPDDGVDVIQVTLDWTSPLEREPFEAAWHLLTQRHEILRTAFRLDDEAGLVQVIDQDASPDIRWRDLPQPPASGPDRPFESFLRADRRERFDLTRRPPVRLTIVRWVAPSGHGAAGSSVHRVVLTFHHALLDGRSLRLLIEEFSAVYAALLAGRAAPVPPRPAFGEFVRWWQTTDPAASRSFWTEYLAGAVVPRPLPGYLGEQAGGTSEPATAETVLSLAESEAVRQAASATGLSPSTMVSAAWAVLRARYGGVTDVLLAVTRSCARGSIPDADAIIGPLINTVPLRVRVGEGWSARELVTAVNDGIRQIREHQRTPMGAALAWAGLPVDTALVDCLLVFDRSRLQARLAGRDGLPSSARMDRLPSYPLTLFAWDEPQLRLEFDWDRSRFADGSVQQLLDELRETLIELARNLSKPAADLDPGATAGHVPQPAAAPASIGRRDRAAYQVATPRSAAAPPSIGRRDRSAYRVAASPVTPDAAPVPAPHLVPLTEDWALWRTVCLRGAGFPVRLLAALGDADLARAADAAIAAGAAAPAPASSSRASSHRASPNRASSDPVGSDPAERDRASAVYAAEFTAGVQRLSAALYEAAGLPRLREAVGWQNRHALSTGIDVVVRRGPEPGKRNAQRKQHQALVASYVQRYCAKNDTIGFFGPVGWAQIDDGSGIRIAHAAPQFSLAARVTYLEGWAVRALMERHGDALRPWLIPRRMPSTGVDGTVLRVPLAPPVPLTTAEAAVLRACDSIRDARGVVAEVLADPRSGLGDDAEVLAVLAKLADSRRVAWQVEVAPQDMRPEHTMRALLSRVTDDGIRGAAEAKLDELTAARDELAGAAGDAERVAVAMNDLEATFTRLADLPPTRRAGELYAGRTIAYEECLRGDTVRLGADVLDGLRAPLALVLDSARWFTAASGALFTQRFEEVYRDRVAALGTEVVPFADVWMLVSDVLDDPPKLIKPVMDEVRQRWSAILDLPAGSRRVQFRAADLRERVTAQFPAGPLPWPTAAHHSPDLMIAGADAASGGRLTWVLGEVHPSMITIRYATWLAFHPDADGLHAGLRHDLGGPAVFFAESGELGGTSTRLCNVLPSPGDVRLMFARDSFGYDPAATVPIGDCDVIRTAAGLRVRRRDRTFERGLLEVVGDLIGTTSTNHFDVVPPGPHTPRVTIDDLVVSRETWRLPAAEPAFADTADESTRYLQARTWAASHGMPRHVFCRFAGERKPIYADLTSLASIDLMSRSLRRSRRTAGPDATVNVVEMMPTPEQAWLTDAQGQHYASEVRMVAVDRKAAVRKQEG